MRTNCQGRLRLSRRLSSLSRPRQWISHLLKAPLKLPSTEEVVPLMSCALITVKFKLYHINERFLRSWYVQKEQFNNSNQPLVFAMNSP